MVLPRLIGYGKAMYLALTGSKITAAKALEIGLVDAVVPDSSAESFVRELIKKISEKPYDTVSTIKDVMVSSMNSGVPAGLEYEATAFGRLLSTEETRKRISGFISKHSHDNSISRQH